MRSQDMHLVAIDQSHVTTMAINENGWVIISHTREFESEVSFVF